MIDYEHYILWNPKYVMFIEKILHVIYLKWACDLPENKSRSHLLLHQTLVHLQIYKFPPHILNYLHPAPCFVSEWKDTINIYLHQFCLPILILFWKKKQTKKGKKLKLKKSKDSPQLSLIPSPLTSPHHSIAFRSSHLAPPPSSSLRSSPIRLALHHWNQLRYQFLPSSLACPKVTNIDTTALRYHKSSLSSSTIFNLIGVAESHELNPKPKETL